MMAWCMRGVSSTFVGDLENRHGALAQQLAHQLSQAGLAATAVDDIRSRLWQKLAVNAAINPLVALNGIYNGELRGAAYAGCVEAVAEEVAAIMLAEGIQAPSGGAVWTRGWRWCGMLLRRRRITRRRCCRMLRPSGLPSVVLFWGL